MKRYPFAPHSVRPALETLEGRLLPSGGLAVPPNSDNAALQQAANQVGKDFQQLQADAANPSHTSAQINNDYAVLIADYDHGVLPAAQKAMNDENSAVLLLDFLSLSSTNPSDQLFIYTAMIYLNAQQAQTKDLYSSVLNNYIDTSPGHGLPSVQDMANSHSAP